MQNTKCRLCKNPTLEVINFGQMPIANHFVGSKIEDNYRFEMIAAFCPTCFMFQITEHPEPEMMFHSEYPFFTGLSKSMTKHFEEMAEEHLLIKEEELEDFFVVEIGSNDGTFLHSVSKKGIKHLGIDPSSNVVKIANEKGINSEVLFFSENAAFDVLKRYKKASRIFAANVICHIPDLNDFAKGIKVLLAEKGQFIFEEPYLLSMLEKTSYDQIYDEHVYIFSISSIQELFRRHGLEVVDAIAQNTHGGSMRYVIQHIGQNSISLRAKENLWKEIEFGINQIETYLKFAINCASRKVEFKSLLQRLKSEGSRVAGYAATSKSTTVLNYCGITEELIEYISDSTPEKIGKLCPGTYIPVISHEQMRLDPPDYLVLFAWNHEVEILSKELELTKKGVKWIKFVPEVGLVNEK